jgi:hypothetical protein
LVLASPALAQVRTSDPMTTRSLSIDGELHAGAAQFRRGSEGCRTTPEGFIVCEPVGPTVSRPFATLAVDVQDRVLRLGREEEALFVELDANLRIGVREAYADDGSWRGAWLNVWIAAAIAHRTPSLTLRASFGIAPPLRTAVNRGLPDSQLTAGWGQWDQWLATIDIVPFGFTGLVEGRLEQIDLGADTAIVLGPGFSGTRLVGPPDPGLYFWTGVGGWLAAHLGEAFRLGLRLQGVFWLNRGYEERCDGSACRFVEAAPQTDFQASVIPFVRVVFPPGYLELRLQINLDEPHGPTLVGAEQVWAIALRGGASWDG